MLEKNKKLLLIVIIITIIVALVLGYYESDYIVQLKIKYKSEKWEKFIRNKNVDEIYNIFCERSKKDKGERIKEQLEEVFLKIDGDIKSIDAPELSFITVARKNIKIIYYHLFITFYIKTNNGNKYMISFDYNYIWKDRPDFVGVDYIYFVGYNDLGEKIDEQSIEIGEQYLY